MSFKGAQALHQLAEPLEDPRRTRSGAQGFVECAIIYILSIYIGRLEYLVT